MNYYEQEAIQKTKQIGNYSISSTGYCLYKRKADSHRAWKNRVQRVPMKLSTSSPQ